MYSECSILIATNCATFVVVYAPTDEATEGQNPLKRHSICTRSEIRLSFNRRELHDRKKGDVESDSDSEREADMKVLRIWLS